MKLIIALIIGLFFTVPGFTQEHLYTKSCCRYFKCPPGEHCATQDGDPGCPACLKDWADEEQALKDEEHRKSEEKAAKDKANQQKWEAELKQKADEDKRIDNNRAMIGSPKSEQKYIPQPTQNKIQEANYKPSGFEIFNDGTYLGIKKGLTIGFRSVEYSFAHEINPENKFFFFYKKNSTSDLGYVGGNDGHIYNTAGEKITINGYSSFSRARFVPDENCSYLVVLTGNTLPRLKYITDTDVNAAEDIRGYINEDIFKKWVNDDATLVREWYGKSQPFDKSIILKVDRNIKLIEEFTGYSYVTIDHSVKDY
jgi:hypothetical protein